MTDVCFTGTQYGMTADQVMEVWQLLEEYRRQGAQWFHHGDCVGADAQAHLVAQHLRYKICIHPPKNPSKRANMQGDRILPAEDYLVRNRSLVRHAGSGPLIATPKETVEVKRSGTWATVRFARRQGRHVDVVTPW